MKKLTVLIATAVCCCAIASAASISSKDKEQGRSLARIDATLKSYLGNPLTGLVYAASLAIGAISILSMYESPLSPLPVPSLPKPPVGRFPPENPIWPPVAKQPVKLRHSSPSYAASNVNPIYSLAPSKVASHEENSWGLEGQNLVQNYHNFLQSQGGQQILAAAAAAANSGAAHSAGGSRRQDQLQAAHLQSYINQMSKVPSIRLKANGQLADSSVPVSHSSATSHPVKHSTSSSVSEVNSSLPSPSSSSSLSPSLSSSSTSSVSSASSSSSAAAAAAAAAVPADPMQDYSAAAAAA